MAKTNHQQPSFPFLLYQKVRSGYCINVGAFVGAVYGIGLTRTRYELSALVYAMSAGRELGQGEGE